MPIVLLHGGPGAGNAPWYYRFFDPDVFHIVIYEQRGAPLSIPPAELTNNSCEALVDDNDKLRVHLGISQWHVFGGSWGATLALLYAEKYPTCVLSLTLRGVFMMRRKEIEWFMSGMRRYFPEVYEEFENFIPEVERRDLLRAYYERLTSTDEETRKKSARMWTRFENGFSFLHPLSDEDRNDPIDEALCMARIEAHFFIEFLAQEQHNRIIDNISSIRYIPTMIVQGRYDIVCPPESAWELNRQMVNCTLNLTATGHSARELDIMRELVAATKRIRDTGVPIDEETLSKPDRQRSI